MQPKKKSIINYTFKAFLELGDVLLCTFYASALLRLSHLSQYLRPRGVRVSSKKVYFWSEKKPLSVKKSKILQCF